MVNDFRPFGPVMTKLSTRAGTVEPAPSSDAASAARRRSRRIDTSYELYLGLYQAITGPAEHQKVYRELSRDFLVPVWLATFDHQRSNPYSQCRP